MFMSHQQSSTAFNAWMSAVENNPKNKIVFNVSEWIYLLALRIVFKPVNFYTGSTIISYSHDVISPPPPSKVWATRLTHPPTFPCDKKPECPEKTHDFRQSVGKLFSHEKSPDIESNSRHCATESTHKELLPFRRTEKSSVILYIAAPFLSIIIVGTWRKQAKS